MVRLTLEQFLASKMSLRGALLGQARGESASRRSEPKTFPFFADKLQRKTPGLGGRVRSLAPPSGPARCWRV